MEENKVLRLIYTIFVGLLLATFVGVGINTFYRPPAAPAFPTILNTYNKEPTPEQLTQQQQFDRKMEQHNKAMKSYNHNVSMLALAAAVVFLVASMMFEHRIRFVADGVILGGLFTLIYSIGRGFASENSKYVFVVVTVGLVIVLYLGYRRFVRDHSIAAKTTG